MSEAERITEVEPLRGTVGFNRKVQVRQYEAAEAFISIQFDIDRQDDAPTIAEKAHLAFTAAKGVVFEELGIEYEITEGNILQEVVRANFGGNVTESSGPASPSPAAQREVAELGEPPYKQEDLDFKTHKPELAENRAWAAKVFLADPNSAWDNRASKPKPSAFDYRNKKHKIGFWESDVKKARDGDS